MVTPIPGFWTYVEEGLGNVNKIFNKGGDAVKEILDPENIARNAGRQASQLIKGGTPNPVMPKPAELPKYVPDIIKDPLTKYAKYAKYALIGGGVLIAYSVLKK